MDRAERAAAAPPTVEPDPGNAGEGKVIEPAAEHTLRRRCDRRRPDRSGLRLALQQRGLSVLVVDRALEPGAEASRVAAGMLAPVTEADFGEEALLRVNLLGRERWPAFAAELEERSGLATGYRESGALVVAADRDDAEALRRLHEFQLALGLDVEWLPAEPLPRASSPACRRGSPAASTPTTTPRPTRAPPSRALAGVRGRDRARSRGARPSSTTRGRVTGVRTAAGPGGVRRRGGGGRRVEPGA